MNNGVAQTHNPLITRLSNTVRQCVNNLHISPIILPNHKHIMISLVSIG